MRTRAGIILIEDNKVALIERHRGGLDYFVFPGGGVYEGETPEQAAIREAMEELGLEVAIKQKVVIIHFDQSTQIYFLMERAGGEFGTGTGEEFTDSDPNDPQGGIYVPIWMPLDELLRHEKIYPVELGNALHSMEHGAVWLTYSSGLDQSQITDLQKLVRGHGYVLMSPYPSQKKPVVMTA